MASAETLSKSLLDDSLFQTEQTSQQNTPSLAPSLFASRSATSNSLTNSSDVSVTVTNAEGVEGTIGGNAQLVWKTENEMLVPYISSSDGQETKVTSLEFNYRLDRDWTNNGSNQIVFNKHDNPGFAWVQIHGSTAKTTTLTTSKGINLAGSEIYVQIGIATNSDGYVPGIGDQLILNLGASTLSDGSRASLIGDIRIAGGYGQWDLPSNPEPIVVGNFAGDIQGNITLENQANGWRPVAQFTFDNDAKLTGNFTSEVGVSTFYFANGYINGNFSMGVGGNAGAFDSETKFYKTVGNDFSITGTNGIIRGNLTVSGYGDGYRKLLFGYSDEVNNGSKTITFDPNDTKVAITGGTLTFYNMKALNFTNTLAMGNSKLNEAFFLFDRSIADGSTIITGSIESTGKSVRLAFVDSDDATLPSTLPTFNITGGITITGGGLSLFYNDTLGGFEAKVSATGGISQSGGYIGRNDAFFEAGTFTAEKNNTDLLTIQGTNGGISHLRFNDNVSVSNGISSTSGNGTELYFYQGVDINTTGSNTVGGDGINKIYLSGTNTITGNITTNAGTQLISQVDDASATLSLQNSLIKAYGGGTASITINTDNLTITGSSSLLADGNNNGNNTISITTNTANISLTSIGATTNNKKKNIINIASGTFGITGGISSTGGINQINLGTMQQDITIGGQVNASGSGQNAIEITSGNLTISQGIIAQGYGNTSENVLTLHNGNLVITGGSNPAIKTHNGGDGTNNTNTISVNGDFTANGNIYATSGKNEITFTGNGVVTGNIQIDSGNYGGQNIFHLSGTSTTLKLQGQNNTISTITGYVTPTPSAGESRVTSGVATLILDGANATTVNSGVSATIKNAINTGKLAINFNGNETNIAKLTLSAGDNTLEDITLGSDSNTTSTNNTLELSQGQTSIAQNVAIDTDQTLTFDLKDGTTLAFNGGLTTVEDGTATFNLGSSSAPTTTTTISGDLENSGSNVFNVESATTTLKYGDSGLGFSSGTNIINFKNTSSATLTWQDNAGTTQAISTTGGNTKINFTNSGTISEGVSTSGGNTAIAISDGKSATISGDISTSGGATSINFLGNESNPTNSTGTLSGNISTSGGTTTIAFTQNGGTYTIANANTFSTSGAGQNIIDLSSKSVTIDNNLSFTGSNVTGEGGNIIKIGNSQTLTLQDTNNDATTLTTQDGATYLNFAETSNLSGNIATTGGSTTFNLGSSDELSSDSNSSTATITGTITNSAENIFNVNSATTNFKYGSGLAFSDGTNKIIFTNTSTDGATLTWKDSSDNTQAISTTGGNTEINFANNGTISGGVSTSGSGNTTITISDGKSGKIQEAVTTSSGGTTTIKFASGNTEKTLTLVDTDNTITDFTFDTGDNSTNNTIALSQGTTTFSGNALNVGQASGNTQELTFALSNDVNLALTNGLTTNTTGTTLINFLGDGSNPTSSAGTLSGNISTTGGTTTITFAQDSGTYGVTGTLSTSGAGQNIIDLSTNNATISNDLSFTGSGVTGVGGNIINIGDNKTLALSAIVDGASTAKTINTASGKTYINFAETSNLSGNIATTGGSTTFNLGSSDELSSDSNSATATITGTITNTDGTNTGDDPYNGGTNIFNINAQTAILKNGASGLEFANGLNIINFKNTSANGATLDWKNSSGNTQAISTTGGNTEINFINDGTISGGVSTSGNGNTTIAISDGKTATIQTTGISTSAGTTVINFLGNSTTPANSTGKLSGNISTSGGATTIAFAQDGGIYSIAGILSTSAEGKNIIDLSNNSVTISNDLSFTGSGVTGEGGNIINIGSGKAFTLSADVDGTPTAKAINTGDGKTYINFNGVDARLSGNIATTNGATDINFSKTGTIVGGVATNGANATTTINISDDAVASIKGAITLGTSGGSNNVAFNSTSGKTSTLILQGSTNKISTLTMGAGENILALTEKGPEGQIKRDTRKVEIDNVIKTATGSLKLVSQISSDKADTFLINNATDKTRVAGAEDNVSPYQISLVLAQGTDSNQIAKDAPVLVATVKNNIGIEFEKTSKFVDGFVYKEADFVTTMTDQNGNANESGDYTSYLVGSVVTDGIVVAEQAVTATAFMLNYDLYMANLNSLNKRMGELRENAHSQGVWARVFNGAQTNTFGLGSKNNYTTIQAGYDYAFGFEGANTI